MRGCGMGIGSMRTGFEQWGIGRMTYDKRFQSWRCFWFWHAVKPWWWMRRRLNWYACWLTYFVIAITDTVSEIVKNRGGRLSLLQSLAYYWRCLKVRTMHPYKFSQHTFKVAHTLRILRHHYLTD